MASEGELSGLHGASAPVATGPVVAPRPATEAPGPSVPLADIETYQCLLDPATGLPGWVLLLDRTAVALTRARRTHRAVAVLVVDRPAYRIGGSAVPLAAVVDLLRERIRPDDTLAVLEPGRYAVLCPDLRSPADAERIAERLVKHCGDLTFGLGIAVGGAGDDAVQLVSWASQHAPLPSA